MIVPAYVPGEWLAVVTDGTLAVLPPDTSPSALAELWAAIRDGASLTDLLQVLLRPGIAHVPPFALVSLERGQVQVVVRGAVRVEVTTPAGTRSLCAAHISTWAEEVLTGALAVAVRTGPAAVAQAPQAAADRDALPVLAAVVRVCDVLVDLRAAAPLEDLQPVADPAARPDPSSVAGPALVGEQVAPVVAQPEPVGRPPQEPAAADQHFEPVPPSRPVWAPVAGANRPVAPERVYVEPVREVAPEPVREPSMRAASGQRPPDALRSDAPAPSEDHDGLTVLSSDVVALRRQLPGWAGDAVPALAVPTPRTPPPAKLLMSSGLTVALNRPVLIGRAPQVSRVANAEIPRLLTVASPNQDISRTHAEVRMDGEDVIVTDLRSTNGVLLLRQGAGPQRLHPGEPTVVESGVVVDLGEGVTFVVEAGG